MQLGLENKKQTTWAAVLGVVAVLAMGYEVIPMFTGPSTPVAAGTDPAAPVATHVAARTGGKSAKKVRTENLDPTLKLGLLAASEQTKYEGSGRNIFVSAPEEVKIENPRGSGATDHGQNGAKTNDPPPWVPPSNQPPPPIPLKFYGFANSAGEPRKVFLKSNEDVWVAGEGEIVDRRYKVIRITPTSVSIQDMVYSGPPQNIPLTQG